MEYVLPSILSVVVAKFVADAIIGRSGHSNLMIQMKNYSYLDNREDACYKKTVWQVFQGSGTERQRRPLVVLPRICTIANIRYTLASCEYGLFPIVDSSNTMLIEGTITRDHLLNALITLLPSQSGQNNNSDSKLVCFIKSNMSESSTANPGGTTRIDFNESYYDSGRSNMDFNFDFDLSACVDKTPLSVHPSTNMGTVHALFIRLGLRYVLIKSKGRVLDIVTRKDMITSFDSANRTFAIIERESETPLDLDPVITYSLREFVSFSKRIRDWIQIKLSNIF